jgi:hypothetical protein
MLLFQQSHGFMYGFGSANRNAFSFEQRLGQLRRAGSVPYSETAVQRQFNEIHGTWSLSDSFASAFGAKVFPKQIDH